MVWSIQSDLRGNARIWSNNLQIVCVQLPTSLQIRVGDGHHGRHGHHGRDGHYGRHGPLVTKVIRTHRTTRTTKTHGTDRTDKQRGQI